MPTSLFSIPFFRFIALLEGLSFLVLLFIAMPLKYMFDSPEMVRVTGMAHGVLFVMYVMWAIILAIKYSWSAKFTFYVLIGSVLPFGTFVVDYKLLARR